jgi:hypothetical protein
MTRGTNVPLRVPVPSPQTVVVTRVVLLVLLLLALSSGAAAASGGDNGGGGGKAEVRVVGDCGPGARSSLRVQARDDGIDVRFRLQQTRGRGVWRLTIVHENRVSFRATRTTTRAEDSFELRRTLRDLGGSDTVVVQAWGSSGLGCRATATLPGTD